jgi:uncharacterized membrane protein
MTELAKEAQFHKIYILVCYYNTVIIKGIKGMTTPINVTVDSANFISPTPKPSKQLNYYYRHQQERLNYQQIYYNKHKNMILSNKHHHDLIIKVKRTENNNRLLRIMRVKFYSVLNKPIREKYWDAYHHTHGRPNLKHKRSYYCLDDNRFWFHAIPEIPRARELTLQQAHFLGLKLGDSIVWREMNKWTHKVETHTVCFDRSGLDSSHESNLPSLVACRIETGLKGMDLLAYFANRYSVNHYLMVWRGNKLLLTSERENALKQWLKLTNMQEYYSEIKNVIYDFPREILYFPELT